MNRDPSYFKVLTYNAWALRFLSKKRLERLEALGELLRTSSSHDYDVVCLQEVWVEADVQRLQGLLQERYPHSAYWHSSVIGSGLIVFSKWPILERDFTTFGICGQPAAIGGDWYAGKSFGSVVLDIPNLGPVEVFNTHFYHLGGEDGPERKRAVRISNAWEMTKRIRKSAASGHHVLACGDYNSTPETLPMKVILAHGDLTDTWAKTNPIPKSSEYSHGTSSPESAVKTFGLTCDIVANSWTVGKSLDNYARTYHGKRLDYILYRPPQNATHKLEATKSTVILNELVPGQSYAYSDHFGVETTFRITPSSSGDSATNQKPTYDSELSSDDLLTCIDALYDHLHESESRTRRYSLALGLSVLTLLFSLLLPATVDSMENVITWRWSTFLVAFVAALAGCLGTLSIILGIVHGIRERGRLANLIAEMECFRRRCAAS